MKMKRKFGILCMVCGLLLLIASAVLVFHNQQEDIQAANSSQAMLLQLQEQIAQAAEAEGQTPSRTEQGHVLMGQSLLIREPDTTETLPDGILPAESTPSEPALPDNPSTEYGQSVSYTYTFDYIGYLSIPVLDLELPVISQWSTYGAQFAPCRHSGSVSSDDLIIAGHNYRHHFGRLKELQLGDLITITQLDGTVTGYQVDEIKTVAGNDVEAVQNTDWALILYTCTYGGQNRVVICCSRIT